MALSTTQYGYIIDPMVPFTDDKGKTIKNGFVRVFVAGSSTPVVTYRNFDGATNQDRIELDNSGRTMTSVIGSKGLTYKVCVYDQLHSQESPILTVDKVPVIGTNIMAGAGATVITGLDGLTTKPDGFVDASVVGTDGYVALDHTLVTDDLDTDAKVTAVEDDRYVPLLNKDVNDPDSKMTLGRLWQWVLGKIKSLSTTITAFRTGDYIAVDGPSGTAKMSKDDLLRVTAENAAASGLLATKPEFNDLNNQINGNNGVIASGLFSANDTLFVSSDVSEGDNVVVTLKNGEPCQVRFLDSASNVLKAKNLNSETTTWETTIPSSFDKAVVIWNSNSASIEVVDTDKIADGLEDDVRNNTSNISSLSARVKSTEHNLFGYDGIVADADFSDASVVFTKDSFADYETASIKVTLAEGDGCTIRFLDSNGTIKKSRAFTEDDNVWETTIPSNFDNAVVIWNNNDVHILVVNESRKILSVQARLDEKIGYDKVYLVDGEKQKRFYSEAQGVSQDDEDNGTSKYDSVEKNNTSWEVSKNTAGVFYNLMKSGKEYRPAFSQMFFYNYRKENEWQLVDGQIVPKDLEDVDLDDTMQYIDTGKRPLLYAVDAYDCLPNGWYSGEHQQKRKASLIAIVKKAWQQYKAIPVMSWHLENPYTPHAFGTINDGAASYRDGQNITLSDSTIFQYPNTHYDVMGEILNHTSYDDGVEISDDGHWLPSTTSTKCGKGNYFGSDLAGYSAPYLWYEDKMQELADLVNEFVDEDGAGIPMILRLFHEPEDRWAWWGNPIYSGVNTYKSFVQYTITQLRTKFIHKNVLFGYCMDIYWSNESEYIKRYAGDDYIDVVGYDDYTIGTSIESIDEVTHKMRVISKFANEHLKIAALFETGNRTAYQKEHDMLNDYLYKSLSEKGVEFGICELWSSFVINSTLIENDYTKFLHRNDIRTYEDYDNLSIIREAPSEACYKLNLDVYGIVDKDDTTATYTAVSGEYIGSGVQIASAPDYSRTPCIAVTKGQHVIFSAGTKYNPNNVAVAMTSAASVSLGDVLDTSNYEVFGTTWTTENFDYEVPYDGYVVVAWSDTFAPTSITIRTITIVHDGLLLHKYVECNEQSLTDREKTTVRNNIGALGKNDVIPAMTPCLTILADDWGYTGGTREAKHTQLKTLCDTLGVKATWAAIPDGDNSDGYSYVDHYALTFEEMQLQGFSFLVHPNHDYWRGYTDVPGMDRSTIGAVIASREAGIENANFLVYPYGGGINANSFKMAYKWCNGVGINAGYAPYYNEYGQNSVNLNRLFIDDISAGNIDSYKTIVANAYAKNAWVILGLHPVNFDNDKFDLLEELVNYAIGLGTMVATFQEAWNILRKNFK